MHLADEVLPDVPIRQWVLSLLHPVLLALACDARLCAAVRRIFVRTLLGWRAERERESLGGARVPWSWRSGSGKRST